MGEGERHETFSSNWIGAGFFDRPVRATRNRHRLSDNASEKECRKTPKGKSLVDLPASPPLKFRRSSNRLLRNTRDCVSNTRRRLARSNLQSISNSTHT